MHEFRRPPRRTVFPLLPVLSSDEFQVPPIEQMLLLIRASDALALVGLDLQVASAADVPKVSPNRASPRTSAGDFDHDFRSTAHSARNVCNLRDAESTWHLRTAAPVTDDVEEPGPTDGTRNTRLVNAALPGNQRGLGELVHTPLHFRYECSAAADLLLQISRHVTRLHGLPGGARQEPTERARIDTAALNATSSWVVSGGLAAT